MLTIEIRMMECGIRGDMMPTSVHQGIICHIERLEEDLAELVAVNLQQSVKLDFTRL